MQTLLGKLLRKSINALYRLAGYFFPNLSSRIYQYGNYRYSYSFSEFTSINSINGRYDKYHSLKLDNCPYLLIKTDMVSRYRTDKMSVFGRYIYRFQFYSILSQEFAARKLAVIAESGSKGQH